MAKHGNHEILDTSSPKEMILDMTLVTTETLLNLQSKSKRNNMTISFRIDEEELEWAKEVSRRIALKEKKDINYQQLMRATFLEKYPMKKGEKNE